jgi:hypothetical protein
MRALRETLGLAGLVAVAMIAAHRGTPPAASAVEPSEPASHVDSPEPADAELPVVTTPAELREYVRRCRSASERDSAWLRRAALESPDPLVAGNGLRALGRLGVVVGDEELLALTEDERPRVRQELVLVLALARNPGAREHLDAITREDPELAALAARASAALQGRR